MTELESAKELLEKAEREVTFATAYVRQLKERAEAEPGIVTFEAMVASEHGVTFIESEQLRPLFDPFKNHVHVAVSRKPFVSYTGVEVARGEFYVGNSNVYMMMSHGCGMCVETFVKENAKDGNQVIIVDGGE